MILKNIMDYYIFAILWIILVLKLLYIEVNIIFYVSVRFYIYIYIYIWIGLLANTWIQTCLNIAHRVCRYD